MSDETYTGPWCNIKTVDGRTHSIKGTRADLHTQLSAGPLAELENIHGAHVTIGTAHVVSIDEMPLSSSGFTQIEHW